MDANQEVWDYRVVGININKTDPSNPSQASEKLGKTLSKEYLEKEFPKEYVKRESTNMALQCQQVIQLYGKNGWEHYQQGQLGNMAMLYFRKRGKPGEKRISYSAEETILLSSLNELQHP